MFDGMGRDHGCRKKVLHILKIILKRQTERLTSHNMKTALLHEVKIVSSWKHIRLVPRLIVSVRSKSQSEVPAPATTIGPS